MSILLEGVTLIGNKENAAADPVGAFITSNATAMNQKYQQEQQQQQQTPVNEGTSQNIYSNGSVGTNTSNYNYATSSLSKKEKSYLSKMKDSNVPYYYEHDENDLMYLAASEKRDSYWELKEEIFLYSIHDRKKHRYITSIQIDGDASDIVTTCQVTMPFDTKLMEYYIPGKTAFMIIGGTFDREVLFVGRVSEVNQRGQEIEVVGQNIGWKFKQYMSEKFLKQVTGLPVPLAVKAVFKELGFTEGKYHMDLWAIPNVFKYKVEEDCTISYKGEQVQNVPDLDEVVSRMKKADINKYVAERTNVQSTQKDADTYDKFTKIQKLDSVVNSSVSAYPSYYRRNYGISATIKKGEVEYDPIEEMIYGSDKTLKYFTEDHSGESEYTFNDLMQNIASSIDAQFFIVDTTVCFVSFNAMMSMKSSETIAKAIKPRIEYWQMLDKSYELDINQYGYYNTVIIKYKDGTIKRSFEDLVRVYGEIPITYKEPDLNYEGAQLKAHAYLAAHVRDFGMQIRFSMLYSGKITVGSFAKVQNPLTMSESLLYIYGLNVQWSADGQTLTCDVDCRYGPENPDDPEIPEYGLDYTSARDGTTAASGNVSANISQAAKQMIGNATDSTTKGARIYDWVDKNITYESYSESKYTSEQVLTGKRANCWDTAMLIYDLCTAVGVKCEVHNGSFHFASSGSIGHLWNKIEHNGQMVFADTGRTPQNPMGSLGGGYIESDSLMKKNY